MKKTYSLAAVCMFTAISLAACSPAGSSVSIPNVIQVDNSQSQQKTIQVNGNETVKVEPDKASITYGITTQGEDSEVCQQENTEKMNQVIEYLKSKGYEETSIATSGFTMNPRYDWSGEQQRLIGYEMRSQITLSDVPIAQVGELLSGAVAQGANEIQNVQYYSSSYDEAYQEALEKAVESAKSKAEAMAHADGYQVTDVLHIYENGNSQYGRYLESGIYQTTESMASGAEKSADMTVMPGQMEVTAEITVEFEILPQ